MRRSEREVTDCNEIRQILERAEVLRLAMHDEPYPYIVPVNFGFTMQDDHACLIFSRGKSREEMRPAAKKSAYFL